MTSIRKRSKEEQRAYYAERQRAHRKKPWVKEKNREYMKKWRSENTEYLAEWRKKNAEQCLEYGRKGYRKHRSNILNFSYERMTEFERLEVDQMYLFCSAFPWFEVDHIVPLKAKNHSGLHVRNNLQVLDKTLNRKKGNKVCPAYITIMEGILPAIQNYGR